ncbi:MAG: glycosyl hydrolase family protein [Ignavibacteriales bacterium]|nr:MAG: glycosyl hydrolase family protein [Ignavibacteriales bacterium]
MKKAIILFLLVSLTGFLHAKDYYGAEYRTKEAYTYGRFEAKIKAAQRDGMLASFFTYYDGVGTSNWNEIDIEILGRYENNIQFNTITPGQKNHVRSQPVNFNPSLDYHTYAFEWTPDYVAWFIDGEEVYRQTGEHISTLVHPQKIMMNIWNPAYDNWVGTWNENALPAFAYYDFVSYYSYTPGTGSYGSQNNFTHLWTDNLDSWDETKWEKGTHTWNGNNCSFIHDNAVFSDGKLILCLTNNTNIGYTDVKPPYLLWVRAEPGRFVAKYSEELDKTSAENKNLYLVSGVTIDSVRLQDDKKTMLLFTSNLDLNKSYNLITYAGIKDLFVPPNTSTLRAVSINMSKPLSFPVKINIGGPEAMGFLPDQRFNETTEYGYCEGSTSEVPAETQINNTEDDSIFQSEQYGLVAYKVRVPNGLYKLQLLLSENYFSTAGSRVFDIYIEDSLSADNLDVFQVAGKNNAYVLTFENIHVTDEILDLYFAAEIDNTLLNGIIIDQLSTGEIETGNIVPDEFQLHQNFPNPFNGRTIIKYNVAKETPLDFYIFDALGKTIYSKHIDLSLPGENMITWDSKNESNTTVSSGIYFYTLRCSNKSLTRKLLVLK